MLSWGIAMYGERRLYAGPELLGSTVGVGSVSTGLRGSRCTGR